MNNISTVSVNSILHLFFANSSFVFSSSVCLEIGGFICIQNSIFFSAAICVLLTEYFEILFVLF